MRIAPTLLSIALAAVPVLSASAAPAGGWIADDYARALAEAKARHVPIFVDAWAPW